MSEKEIVTEDVIDNPEIRAILESYITIMMHKDLVELVTQYSIVKGRENWEEEFEKLLQGEIKKANGVVEPETQESKKNVKKFKI